MTGGGGECRRVHIKSLGCRTNQEEMASLRMRLFLNGFSVVDTPEESDVVIVNTCSVTSGTESKTLRMLRGLLREYPAVRIMVTGCLAQQKPQQLKSAGIHWVVGNTFKKEIVSILQNQSGGIFHAGFDKEEGYGGVDPGVVPLPDDFRTRFPVKIQEGCDYRCAYCIVPQLRGPSRSVSAERVLSTCTEAVGAGFKEIVLAGTHIGQFGKQEGLTLVMLLEEIMKIEGDFRVRLSSLDPRDLDTKILQMAGEAGRVCDHLHVSVQSLNGDVLNMMGRDGEGVQEILKKLLSFRRNFPHAGLGGDFIVGFPGETEEMFQETLENVSRVGFSYGHVFRFSARPGTAAFSMPGQIPEGVKTERSSRLRKALEESRAAFLESCRGISLRIIVESGETVEGLTSNYIRVRVPEISVPRNSWLEVRVKTTDNYRYCIAEPFTRKDI